MTLAEEFNGNFKALSNASASYFIRIILIKVSLTILLAERKLLAVEEEVLRKAVSDLKSDSVSVEARMLAYQRKYEAEKRAELKAEVCGVSDGNWFCSML